MALAATSPATDEALAREHAMRADLMLYTVDQRMLIVAGWLLASREAREDRARVAIRYDAHEPAKQLQEPITRQQGLGRIIQSVRGQLAPPKLERPLPKLRERLVAGAGPDPRDDAAAALVRREARRFRAPPFSIPFAPSRALALALAQARRLRLLRPSRKRQRAVLLRDDARTRRTSRVPERGIGLLVRLRRPRHVQRDLLVAHLGRPPYMSFVRVDGVGSYNIPISRGLGP